MYGAAPRQEEARRTQTMYGVVLDLPDEFSDEIAAKRRKYSPASARRIFPHITLRGPFVVDDSREIVGELEEVALSYLPVRIKSCGLGSFRGARNNVLYANVERSERLMRLHAAVVDALAEVRDVFPDASDQHLENWVPHITIADGVTDEELTRLEEELRDYEPRAEWDAHEFLLVRSQSAEDGSLLWTTTRAFRAPS